MCGNMTITRLGRQHLFDRLRKLLPFDSKETKGPALSVA